MSDDLSDLIDEAREVSARLNKVSDLLTKRIDEFDSVLKELSFGVEVFLDDFAIDEFPDQSAPQPDDEDTRRIVCSELGYARYNDRWTLCIRDAVYEVARGQYGPDYSMLRAKVRPLRSAARNIRVEAIKRFRALLKALTDKARGMLTVVEEQASGDGDGALITQDVDVKKGDEAGRLRRLEKKLKGRKSSPSK